MNFLIIDIALVVVLVLFALVGRHRGLIMSVCSLLAVVVAIAGALFLSKALAPTVTEWVMPLVEDKVIPAVETVIPEEVTEVFNNLAPGETVKDAITDLLPDDFVLDENTSLPSADQIQKYLEDSDLELPQEVHNFLNQIDDKDIEAIGESTSAEEALVAATGSVTEVVVRIVLFILLFIVILILWSILSHVLNLVSRLPVLKSMNKLGGLLFGLVRGVLFLFLIAWVLHFFPTVTEQLIPPEALEQTYVLKFFLTVNPLEFLASL